MSEAIRRAILLPPLVLQPDCCKVNRLRDNLLHNLKGLDHTSEGDRLAARAARTCTGDNTEKQKGKLTCFFIFFRQSCTDCGRLIAANDAG